MIHLVYLGAMCIFLWAATTGMMPLWASALGTLFAFLGPIARPTTPVRVTLAVATGAMVFSALSGGAATELTFLAVAMVAMAIQEVISEHMTRRVGHGPYGRGGYPYVMPPPM